MRYESGWKGVTKSNPCGICGRTDYCMRNIDNTAFICRRVESKHIAHNFVPKPTRKTIEGTLYVLNDNLSTVDRPRTIIYPFFQKPVEKPDADFTDYAKTAYKATDRIAFASRLGVSVGSCYSIKVGWTQYWHKDHNKEMPAYTIPMRNELLKIIGIRLRFEDGVKRAVKGSSAGFICCPTLTASRDALYICEGESDLLAALDIGIKDILAKPGRLAGDKYIIKLLKNGIKEVGARRPVVIISDNDRDGYEGALRSAKLYKGLCTECKIIIPPAKDLRAWYNAGNANLDKIAYLVNNTKKIADK